MRHSKQKVCKQSYQYKGNSSAVTMPYTNKKKTVGAVLTKVNEYKQSLGISHPMILGATIEASIYIIVVFFASLITSELLWKKHKLIRFSIDGPLAQFEVCTLCSPVG